MQSDALNPKDTIAKFEAALPLPIGEVRRLEQRKGALRFIPPGGIGMEVGVFRGHFSEILCDILEPKKLYLVDPWTAMGETFGWGREYTNFGKLKTADARDEAIARTALYPATEVVVIEGLYPACKDKVEDVLDWAYLDASHKFDPTLSELRAIQHQVKKGGYIFGDDWDPRPDSIHHGVMLAVNAFLRESQWDLVFAGPGRQWVLRCAREA